MEIPEVILQGETYVPYGEEWEKEVMKLPKKTIVQFYKGVCIKYQCAHDANRIMEERINTMPSITTKEYKSIIDNLESEIEDLKDRLLAERKEKREMLNNMEI